MNVALKRVVSAIIIGGKVGSLRWRVGPASAQAGAQAAHFVSDQVRV